MGDGEREPREPEAAAPRPQSLVLSFLGIYLLGRDVAVFSGSLIDVFRRAGIGAEATRSTLSRMADRELLARHRRGRRVYFGLTGRSEAILRDGQARVWGPSVLGRDWDGDWMLIGFSLPESHRGQRHELRSRLLWHGFGSLRNGLWISPAPADLAGLLAGIEADGLGSRASVRVFAARSAWPDQDAELTGAAFDLPAIAARYDGFISRWGGTGTVPGVADDLAGQLLLHADWLRVIRAAPRLPAAHLPASWPAVPAEEIFRRRDAGYAGPAGEIAAGLLDTITPLADRTPEC